MMISCTTINVTRSSLSTSSSFMITYQAMKTKPFIPCDIPVFLHSYILETSTAPHSVVSFTVHTWWFACRHCWVFTKVIAFAEQIPYATNFINLFAAIHSCPNSLSFDYMCHFDCLNSDSHFLLQPIPQAKHRPVFLVFSQPATVAFNLTVCKLLHQQTMQRTIPQLCAMPLCLQLHNSYASKISKSLKWMYIIALQRWHFFDLVQVSL